MRFFVVQENKTRAYQVDGSYMVCFIGGSMTLTPCWLLHSLRKTKFSGGIHIVFSRSTRQIPYFRCLFKKDQEKILSKPDEILGLRVSYGWVLSQYYARSLGEEDANVDDCATAKQILDKYRIDTETYASQTVRVLPRPASASPLAKTCDILTSSTPYVVVRCRWFSQLFYYVHNLLPSSAVLSVLCYIDIFQALRKDKRAVTSDEKGSKSASVEVFHFLGHRW